MSSNFKVMFDNVGRHNAVNRDDIVSKLSRFITLCEACLLVEFNWGCIAAT